MAEATDDTIAIPTAPTPIPTSLNISDLARRFGVDRRTIQRRLKKGWTPPARPKRRSLQVEMSPQETPQLAPHPAPQLVPHPVPQVVPQQAVPHVTVEHHGRVVTTATLLAALALATCSAAFSISGLTSIFAGAFWAVICLGIAFEIGKLSAVAWLGQRLGTASLRLAITALVAVLMGLNSVGVYGFLSRAHIEHALAGDLAVSGAAATVDAKIEARAADLDDIKARIAQLDQTRTVATKGHIRTTTIGDQGPARGQLVQQREAAENVLADLRIEKAKVDGERKAVEADLGPVRYLATLVGTTDEQTMRAFILVVALLLDPAAVLLLLPATASARRHSGD